MEWINIKDRMPEEGEWIIIGSTEYPAIETAMWLEGKYVLPDFGYLPRPDTTHWMPLPETPKQKEE